MFDINDIVKAQNKLRELEILKEQKANGNITEAVLVCHPKVANALKEAIFNNQLKNISIIKTPLVEEKQIYMSTDKEFIKNAREMLKEQNK